MAYKKVGYVSSEYHLRLCDKHPKVKNRASMVHSLLQAYNIESSVLLFEPQIASREDLLMFHSEIYVNCLENIQQHLSISDREENNDGSCDEGVDYDDDQEAVSMHGFGYDCPVFNPVSDYAKAVAGATITAADLLLKDIVDVSINLSGGWHHAHVDEASGFCYVNDIVIGILKLMTKFKRILYIDLDVHHGDGVEEAFLYSRKVMTLSLHKFANGFFPGTGSKNKVGNGTGKYYTVNVPLKDGVNDDMFQTIFQKIFTKVLSVYNPEVIVCQCGADSLTGDPMGAFNLTSLSLVNCVKDICRADKPVMILGGGGYNLENTSRCWTEIVAAVVGKDIDEDIPDHDYLEKYGPDFSLKITPSNRKNENSDEYVSTLLEYIMTNLNHLEIKQIPLERNKENNDPYNKKVDSTLPEKRKLSVDTFEDGVTCLKQRDYGVNVNKEVVDLLLPVLSAKKNILAENN